MIALPSKKPVVADHEMNPACHLHPVQQTLLHPCCHRLVAPLFWECNLLPTVSSCIQFINRYAFLLSQLCCLSFLGMQFLAFLKMQLGETGNASLILVSQVAPPAYPFKEGGSWMSAACALVFGYTASSGATCLSYQRRWQMLHAILICLVTLWVHFGTRAPPVYPFKEGGSRCMRFGLLLCNTWCTIQLTVLLWRGAYNTNIYTFVQWLERGAFNLLQTFDVFPWFCPFPHHFWCLLTLGVY